MASQDPPPKSATEGRSYLAGTFADVRRLPVDLQPHLQMQDRGEASCPSHLLEVVMTALTDV